MQRNFLQILGERGTGTEPGGNALPGHNAAMPHAAATPAGTGRCVGFRPGLAAGFRAEHGFAILERGDA